MIYICGPCERGNHDRCLGIHYALGPCRCAWCDEHALDVPDDELGC